MSFFEFSFESQWYIYLLLFLSLVLFLLVLQKYFNVFNSIDYKKIPTTTSAPILVTQGVIEEVDADDENDDDAESTYSELSEDPVHNTLKAAEMYFTKGETEKAMELWNTIVIDPLPLQKLFPKEIKLAPVQEEQQEEEVQELVLEKPNRLFKFTTEQVQEQEQEQIPDPTPTPTQNTQRDWKSFPPLNAYIQLVMKNIKEDPENSVQFISDAKVCFKEHFPGFSVPSIFF